MIDVVGIGTPFVDYFFEANGIFLKANGLKPENDLLFEEINLTLEGIFSKLKLLHKSPGGMTTNTLRALSLMGLKTSYSAMIGSDKEGEYWLNNIGNLDVSRTKRHGTMSICACILTHQRKYRTFLSQVNKHDADFFNSVDLKFLNLAKHIHIGPFFDSDAKKTIIKLTQLIKQINGPTFSFTPSILHTSFGLSSLRQLLEKINIIFLNRNELKLLIDDEPKKASKKLLQYGPKIIVCTLGDKGALITSAENQFFSKAIKSKKIVDTTGAGDVFAAGFLFGYLRKKTLRWSAQYANKAASLSVSGFSIEGFNNAVIPSCR